MSEIKPSRPKDLMWEAMIEALGYSQQDITRNVRGQINGALKQLREIGATPEDIIQRAQIYRALYPTLRVTATALINRWADLTIQSLETLVPEKIRNEILVKQHKQQEDQKIFDQMVSEGIIDQNGNPVSERKKLDG